MLAFNNNNRRLSPFLDMTSMLQTPHFPHFDLDVFDSAVMQPGYSTTEDKNGTWVEVELPGVRKEDISVDVKGRVLTIEGHRTIHENAFGAATAATESDSVKAGEAAEQCTSPNGVQREEHVGNKSTPAVSDAKQTSSSAKRRRQFKVKLEVGRNTDMDQMRFVSYTDGMLVLFAPHVVRNNGSRRIEIMN